jgi:hypothetical protein
LVTATSAASAEDDGGGRPCFYGTTDDPTGKSVTRSVRCAIRLSSPSVKNILIFRNPKSLVYSRPSCPTEGRFAIVTDAGQDAVDVEAPITNGAEADGEVVWF